MKTSNLITQIVEAAHAQGISQKALAFRAGVPEETISRAKKRGSARLSVVELLARAAGTEIGLVGRAASRRSRAGGDFRDKYGVALAWSNASASNAVLVCRALVKPRFQILLDAAIEFGLDTLSMEWERLKAEGSSEALKASPVTERILGHIRDGYQQATA